MASLWTIKRNIFQKCKRGKKFTNDLFFHAWTESPTHPNCINFCWSWYHPKYIFSQNVPTPNSRKIQRSHLVADIVIRLFLMFQVKIDREIRGSSYPHAWNIVWDPKAVFSLRMSKLLKIGWIAAHWLDSSAVITVTMPSAVGDPEVGRWYNPRDANYPPTSNQTTIHPASSTSTMWQFQMCYPLSTFWWCAGGSG